MSFLMFRPRGAGARPKGFPDMRGPVESLPELAEICGGRREVLDALLGAEMDRTKTEQVIMHYVWMADLEEGKSLF